MPSVRLLIDAHTLIWAVDSPSKLSTASREAVTNQMNDLLLGAGTIWELAIKVGLGKLKLSIPYGDWMKRAISDLNLTVLPITVEYANAQASLPTHHGDPFDRLLVAQSQIEGVAIVSSDALFDPYGVARIW